MTDDDARHLLESKRRRLEMLRKGRKVEAPQHPVVADFEQAADIGSERLEAELELSVSSQLDVRIYEIDHALLRLVSGTWGRCETCSEPIPDERLAFRPESRFCTQHQEQVDQHDRVFFHSQEDPLRLAL